MAVQIPHRVPADPTVRENVPPTVGFPLFAGFPYLVTRLVPVLCHFTPLPADSPAGRLRALARQQVRANRLPAALVLDHDFCLYLQPSGGETLSAPVPGQAMVMLDRLRMPQSLEEPSDLARRTMRLEEFRDAQPDQRVGPNVDYGGWRATEWELRQFAGKNSDRSPRGLTRCAECGQGRGICQESGDPFQLVQVYCPCENRNRCARCGESLHDYRLNAHYVHPLDRAIWYAPGYQVVWHDCRDEPPRAPGFSRRVHG